MVTTAEGFAHGATGRIVVALPSLRGDIGTRADVADEADIRLVVPMSHLIARAAGMVAKI